ncbi:hypothetical protein [Pseudonocardia sp. HH130630-07]|uniref:hypothetical protein n=1 Tax=Pseudonocardia sp. HH130630-07 TaxID=1690815 RepID=UPI000814CECA|nr:hypothetical protein [Pseudonocardia sp. HH130630-07]ANY06113.1 hypothetical protein AFB00_07160 [Pseudonocardia sp. HH130630-07]
MRDEQSPPDPLDALFASARTVVRPGPGTGAGPGPGIDVDRVVAVVTARAQIRRTRRLAVLRAVGLGVVLGGLLGWILLARPAAADVGLVVVLFVVPAVAVLRWHLEALDGRGLVPWRVPPTVGAWSAELLRSGAELDRSVAELDRVAAGLDTVAAVLRSATGPGTGAGDPAGEPSRVLREGLGAGVGVARDDLAALADRLRGGSAGIPGFLGSCAEAPGRADWRTIRSADPGAARETAARVTAALGRMVALAPTLPVHDPDPGAAALVLAVEELRDRTARLLPGVVRRCAEVVRAMDRLHRVASVRAVRRVRGPFRSLVGSTVVVACGWGRTAVARAAIRAVLVAEIPDGVLGWRGVVRRALAAAEIPAGPVAAGYGR